ncbi:hypothetical protein [Methylomarinum vadi]|uniref:hypothetical protein n=1 Tax=Methylomarinum vadi TaxID=438855 RepID=UPI001268BEA3|nr:hypothetical protein [Methylomarinum vadi]
MIQQWWRIAVASEEGHVWQRIREREGRLFGHAWLKDGKGKEWAMRSRVRMKLAQCQPGSLMAWNNKDPKIKHPEVKFPVGSQLYLGYGPLDYKKGLKYSPAIDAMENNRLILMHPKSEQAVFNQTMQLVNWFGTLGGRSRNGWGSIALANPDLADYSTLLDGRAELGNVQRPLEICLQDEWPQAIGTDGKGVLIWKTEAFNSWREVIKRLAEIKIGFRVENFPFKINQDAAKPALDNRHILSYPVTHHGVDGWIETYRDGQPKKDKRGYLIQKGRIANQMRFKVIVQDQKFYGLVFHIPCSVPEDMADALKNRKQILNNQIEIWQKVHAYLDGQLDRTGSQ